MKSVMWAHLIVIIAVLLLSIEFWCSFPTEVKAQEATDAPKLEVDPFWPKPLPDRWVTGEVSVCVDAQDHVLLFARANLTPKELENSTPSPPVIEFDPDGNVVNSWGKFDLLPKKPHGCYFDYQGNVWFTGSEDGIVQKYTHDGSKMLLQIGTKGRFDTSDGTMTAPPMNSSHESLNLPTGTAVDPTNGDVYVSDGYGNRRVVVFDRDGHFLRQ